VKTFYRDKLVPLWHAVAEAVASFLDEAEYRLTLAFCVLFGKMPRKVEKRQWNKSLEAPVLIDAYDWTNDRLIFSVLVWPPLESAPEDARSDKRERVDMVLSVISRGSAEKAMTTLFETDHGLRWDHKRQVWTAADEYAYAYTSEQE
jgi:hypothetical protein